MLRRLLLLATVLLLAASEAGAELYTGEVPVGSNARATSAERLDALDQVLARLTGRFDSSLVGELGLGPGDLSSLVLSQQLVRRDTVGEDGDIGEALHLQVAFDEPSVNELLRNHELPRWGRERPAVLLWAVIEDSEGTRFVENRRMEYVIAEQARRLGLEIVRPLGDVLDLTEISLQDVRGGFLGSAEASARRYGAGVTAMLDLRLRHADTETPLWAARWRWRVEGQDSGLDHSAEQRDDLLRDGLERLASALAVRYAAVETEGEPGRWQVSVSGIVDEVQYAEVLGYIARLSVVDDVQVISAQGRRIDFEVISGARDLQTYLTLGGLLELERRGIEGQLHFRFSR